MKHNLSATLILIFLFLAAQLIGLLITSQFLKKELPYEIQRPEIREETSYLNIISLIVIVSALALILVKLNAMRLWKYWFFLSVVFCLAISFSAFINQIAAFAIAVVLAIFKVFKRNIIVHNFTELFIYGALAAVFVPVLNVLSMIIVLIVISIYDMIAVWKTKHMIQLAKFQTELKLFAGLLVPYNKGKAAAILGGGDIGFPLLFSGVLLKVYGFEAVVVPLFVTAALAILLFKSEKKKFYPAMPFLSLGCLAGFILLLLVS